MGNPNDILLFQGEDFPADIRLRVVPSEVSADGHADGAIIVVGCSIIPGVATGVVKTKGVGGGVSLLTPSFPMRAPQIRHGKARGQVIGVTATLTPGVAVGLNYENWPPAPWARPADYLTDEEIENQNRTIMNVLAIQEILEREENERIARGLGAAIAIGLAYAQQLALKRQERDQQEQNRKVLAARKRSVRRLPRRKSAGTTYSIGNFKFKL